HMLLPRTQGHRNPESPYPAELSVVLLLVLISAAASGSSRVLGATAERHMADAMAAVALLHRTRVLQVALLTATMAATLLLLAAAMRCHRILPAAALGVV